MQEARSVPPSKLTLSLSDNIAQIAMSAQSITNSMETILRAGGAKFGPADWAVLQQLSKEPAQPMKRLAAQVGVSRQRIHKQIEELEAAKLVQVRTTEGDKRSRAVSITPAGESVRAALAATWSEHLAKGDAVKSGREARTGRLGGAGS